MEAGRNFKKGNSCLLGFFQLPICVYYVRHKRRFQGDPPVPKGEYRRAGEGLFTWAGVTGQGGMALD